MSTSDIMDPSQTNSPAAVEKTDFPCGIDDCPKVFLSEAARDTHRVHSARHPQFSASKTIRSLRCTLDGCMQKFHNEEGRDWHQLFASRHQQVAATSNIPETFKMPEKTGKLEDVGEEPKPRPEEVLELQTRTAQLADTVNMMQAGAKEDEQLQYTFQTMHKLAAGGEVQAWKYAEGFVYRYCKDKWASAP